MRISIFSFGKGMPGWVKSGIEEYTKRFPKNLVFSLVELPLSNNQKRTQAIIDKENQLLLKQLNSKDCIIALDSKGKEKKSLEFSESLTALQNRYSAISFLIGGPEGLSAETLAKAQEIWSLSQLTFPHMLARLILVEQIYRSYCFQSNQPYCKLSSTKTSA